MKLNILCSVVVSIITSICGKEKISFRQALFKSVKSSLVQVAEVHANSPLPNCLLYKDNFWQPLWVMGFSMLNDFLFWRIVLCKGSTHRWCSKTLLSIPGISSWLQANTSLYSISRCFRAYLSFRGTRVLMHVVALGQSGYNVTISNGSLVSTCCKFCSSLTSTPFSKEIAKGGGKGGAKVFWVQSSSPFAAAYTSFLLLFNSCT